MSTIDAIYEILEQKGTAPEKMEIEETYKLERDGFEDLIIEKIAEDRISVGQYYTQNGDLMSDPEIVFKITYEGLVSVRYTHHPYMHQHDRSGLSISDFLQTRDKNLRRQGFVESIDFSVSRWVTDYESIRNPLCRAAKNRLTEDYLELVREVQAVNSDADRVEPIFLDRRGNMSEVFEVVGLDYDETRLPLRTAGYEVEKIDPEPEQLQPEHDADDMVTWIRITNEKRIEKAENTEE